MDPAGRKALVTGASRGIGRATALLLAREGADVAINYASNEAAARDVEQEVRAMGRQHWCFRPMSGTASRWTRCSASFGNSGADWTCW